jgi:hypothetical protein
MFEAIAFIESQRVQRRQLHGWGPAPREPLPYAVKTPRSSRAVRAVFSAVIPSFSRTSAPGALAPKRSIDTVRSTQRSHP